MNEIVWNVIFVLSKLIFLVCTQFLVLFSYFSVAFTGMKNDVQIHTSVITTFLERDTDVHRNGTKNSRFKNRSNFILLTHEREAKERVY